MSRESWLAKLRQPKSESHKKKISESQKKRWAKFKRAVELMESFQKIEER